MKYELCTLADTEKLAQRLARTVRGGQILALTGPIGAGKTTFVKAFAAALGVRATVVSPTYTLLQPYTLPRPIRGITTLVHIDAYRLENAAELSAVGAEDFLNDNACMVVIEWAERIEKLLTGRIIIRMKFSFNKQKRGLFIE